MNFVHVSNNNNSLKLNVLVIGSVNNFFQALLENNDELLLGVKASFDVVLYDSLTSSTDH